MHYVYILRSLSTGRHYIGECADLSDRIKRHQENRSKATKGRGPWELRIACKTENRSEARILEIKLKRLKNPEKAVEYILRHFSVVEHSDL